MINNKIIIITGLTGSGKSGLAVKIAKEYNGEIVSCDSVQIYKNLNIGSAKESKETMKQIRHHLIDIKEFNQTYNVGEFIEDCQHAINDIISRGKLPIIVGGTGLYVKALMEGYSLGDKKANLEYRTELENLAKEKGNQHVWDILNKLNPTKAESVHYNNLKRVIRYIELEQLGETTFKTESVLKDYNVLAIGVVDDREIIYNKINKRVDVMLDMGLKQEVEGLINQGATRDMQSVTSIGYREWFDYFEGNQSYERTVELIKQHTRNYCKRQLTFMKTISNLKMLTLQEAETEIKEFLNDTNR